MYNENYLVIRLKVYLDYDRVLSVYVSDVCVMFVECYEMFWGDWKEYCEEYYEVWRYYVLNDI